MNRDTVLDYIEVAAENHIKQLVKYYVEEQYDMDTIRKEIEYNDKIMKYIEENLK